MMESTSLDERVSHVLERFDEVDTLLSERADKARERQVQEVGEEYVQELERMLSDGGKIIPPSVIDSARDIRQEMMSEIQHLTDSEVKEEISDAFRSTAESYFDEEKEYLSEIVGSVQDMSLSDVSSKSEIESVLSDSRRYQHMLTQGEDSLQSWKSNFPEVYDSHIHEEVRDAYSKAEGLENRAEEEIDDERRESILDEYRSRAKRVIGRYEDLTSPTGVRDLSECQDEMYKTIEEKLGREDRREAEHQAPLESIIEQRLMKDVEEIEEVLDAYERFEEKKKGKSTPYEKSVAAELKSTGESILEEAERVKEVIGAWKSEFPELWEEHNRGYS